MGYFVEERWGGSEDSPSVERMRAVLAELDARDDEHPDCWLTHESGWSISADQDGRVIFENVEDSSVQPRHMRGVSRDVVLELWLQLAAGQIEEIQRAPWQPGYGHLPMTPEQRAALETAQLAHDRQFYDSLGPERSEPRCRAAQCSRGAVRASVFCRVHQFENVTRKPCPFSH